MISELGLTDYALGRRGRGGRADRLAVLGAGPTLPRWWTHP